MTFGAASVVAWGCFSAGTTGITQTSSLTFCAVKPKSFVTGLHVQMQQRWERGFTLDLTPRPITRTFEACSAAKEHVSSVAVGK